MKRRNPLLAVALAAAAIGVPAAHAAVKSPYEYLGHPADQGGASLIATAAPVKSPYEYLGHPTGQAMVEPAPTPSPQVAGSTGFQWGDAGIGAGFTLGIVLLLGGAGAGLLISRQNRRHTARV